MKTMPTPLGKKSYAEYAKELKEYNLSKAERVDLALADDVQLVAKRLFVVENESMDIVEDSRAMIKKIESFFGDNKSEVTTLIKKCDLASSEISKLESEAGELENKVSQASKSLGIDPEDIPSFGDMLDNVQDIDEVSGDLIDVRGDLDRLLMNL